MELDLNITSLADRYRTAGLRPSDVVNACLERIAAYDRQLGAFQQLTAEDAVRAAAAADATFARGEHVGPLTGVPFVVKDIYDMAGLVTGKGQPRGDLPVAEGTATVVQRLLSAGAVCLGKTRTTEIAMGGWGVNRAVGTPWNPWDMAVHRVPGGSSAGSAVAVAAGFAAFGLGTDTGGSVRLPAAFCGVTGLNVTAHTLPTDGIMSLSRTLDSPGPIARTVLDTAILFEVMAGRAPALISRDLRSGTGLCGSLRMAGGLTGLRLGAIDERERSACTTEMLEAYDAAIEDLRGLGATVEKVSPHRTYAQIAEPIGTLIDSEAFAVHGADYQDPDFHGDAIVRARVRSGASVSAETREHILAERRELQIAFLDEIRGFDALVTPATPTAAIAVDSVDGAINPAHFTRPFNWLGMCGVALPMGLTPSGLPTSLQIVARGGDEAMALRIAAAFERTTAPIGKPPMPLP